MRPPFASKAIEAMGPWRQWISVKACDVYEGAITTRKTGW
jgi:hypothetical protein